MRNTALSNEIIQRVAPSVFADAPAQTTSDKYRFIPTIEVVDIMRQSGWEPVAAFESRTRKEERQGFQKHMLRFRQAKDIGRLLSVDEIIMEQVLINAHDGSSSFQWSSGFFRCFCDNQCTTKIGNAEEMRVRHVGYDADNVIDITERVATELLPAQAESINEMQQIKLTDREQLVLASAAIPLRWDTEKKSAPIEPVQLLRSRRWDDRKDDLFTTYNRIQENMIRGGLAGRDANNRRRRTRGVNSVTEDVRLNKALWTLAEQMKELKNG